MLMERLLAKVASGELRADPLQEAAAQRLDHLARELEAQGEAQPPGGFLSLLGLGRSEPAPGPRGLYLHGDVGRGKSMLMDLFFDTVRVTSKKRVHFHAFMLDIQARLHALRQSGRQAGGGEDSLRHLAATLAGEHHLLCFDEFHVANIADAMILGRLFEGLFEAGVVVVATSNWPPERLYENGLNRDRFLPFIELLKEKVEVVALDGPSDYRLQRVQGLPVFHCPAGPQADAELQRIFAIWSDGVRSGPEDLPVGSRRLRIAQAAGGVAMTSFAELCAQALGAADYLALTERYHTLILKDVPRLTFDKRNEARRFMTLIDALYERGRMLFLSAEVGIDELYAASEGAFEFRRTASRLMEMQSRDYLERCRQRRQDAPAFVPYALTSDLI